MHARRDLLKLGLKGASLACGAAILPQTGFAQTLVSAVNAPMGPREVSLHNLHTGESLSAIYFDKGAYVPDALTAINHVMRDYRTNEIHEMEPGVFDLWHTLRAVTESKAPFQVISGYRSPQTNAMLHETTSGVASHSYHMKGMATDIRLQDVELSHLHSAALVLGRGGVGYYPASDFVHVDIGPVRHWG